MFRGLYRTAPVRRRSGRTGRGLAIESLEDRYCLSAPQINSFTVTNGSGTTVTLSGHVMDESPTTVSVALTGVASASVTPNSQGNFSWTGSASALGTAYAKAHDNENLDSTQVSVQITSNVPTISFSVTESGPNKEVTVSGTVTDESPSGLVVTFSGKVTGTATTDSTGHFTLTTNASGLGQVNASTSDVWGQSSATYGYTLSSQTPTITNFNVAPSQGNTWIITGTVNDEFAAGLTVTFGGLLAGNVATVASNNTFSLAVTLASGLTGYGTATVEDWWGQVSASVQKFIET